MFITPLFHVGQRITLINDDFSILLAQNPAIQVPVKDTVYVLRRNLQFTHNVGVLLEGLVNVPIPGSKLEPNWNQARFVAVRELPATVRKEEERSYADAV